MKRLDSATRRAQILTTALTLAERTHYLRLTRDQIARTLGISGPAVQYHFYTMRNLRDEVMRAAINREHFTVLAQGILAHDDVAQEAPPKLRRMALLSVVAG